MTRQNQDPTDQMGQLLLSGWTMLQEACPSCHFPLFSSPKDRSRIKCVNCNDLNQTKPIESSPPPPPAIQQAELKNSSTNINSISFSPNSSNNIDSIQYKIDELINELTTSPSNPHTIDYQINLSKLIINCLKIKSSTIQ